MTRRVAAAVLCAALLGPAAAQAAPPANDAPGAAAGFEPVTAANGSPDERQAIAELAEATADAGVPSCLGPGSFARTVWYRVPSGDAAREIKIEGSGSTTDVLDLAAFVQPPGGTNTGEPNACAGTGVGGADAGGEPAAGVLLRVPAGRDVLVQVGRRGAPGPAEEERAVLSLDVRVLGTADRPAGDEAGATTPRAPRGTSSVALGGATITEEDPAQPACPSLGDVWRRFVPAQDGRHAIAVEGAQVGTLTVFRGDRPTSGNAAGCLNRTSSGEVLGTALTLRAGESVWIRLGTDRPPSAATAALRIAGPGDPPPGGGVCTPAGGFRAVSARGRRTLTFRFTRRVARPVTVDVFQQSIGRRVVGERLVARFAGRTEAVRWNGRANRRGRRTRDGYFIVRYRIRGPGGTDVRRIALRRVRGRWSRRPAYAAVEGCGLVRSAKLTRPVFGGRTNRAIGLAFRLSADARVAVEVLRGRRVVRRFATRLRRAGTLHRLRFDAERRPRANYRFRITARSGTRRAARTLVTRRL